VLYQLSYVGVYALGPKVDESTSERLKMVATVSSPPQSRFPGVDAYLKRLADAGLALSDAEEAAGAGETGQAGEAIDRAEEELTARREAWTDMATGERAIVGRTAAPMRARLDRLRTRLPKRTALSEGAPERDPDEEIDPAQAA
jgi:hypothetical protein